MSAPQTSTELAELLLDGRDFRARWLGEDKVVAPFPSGGGSAGDLASRLVRAGRGDNQGWVLVAALDGDGPLRTELLAEPVLAGVTASTGGVLVSLLDLSAALLVTEWYALAAGSTDFMSAFAPEGVDQARARFGQYAKRLGGKHPELAAVAGRHPPRNRSWAHASEVAAGSAVGEQLALMSALVAGSLAAPAFEQRWLQARRDSMRAGERLRDPLATLLDRAFAVIEDYVADPELRDPGELSDEDLVERFRQLCAELD